MRRGNEGRVACFRGETSDLAEQRLVLGLPLARRRAEASVVDAHQRLVLFDNLSRVHQDLGNDAALQVLHDLHAARRNDLAFADSDLVHRCDTRPRQRGGEERERRPKYPMREMTRTFQRRCSAFAHELDIVAAHLR